MSRLRTSGSVLAVVCTVLTVVLISVPRRVPASDGGTSNPYDVFFAKLCEIRQQRKDKVVAYLKETRNLAERIAVDGLMQSAFLQLCDGKTSISEKAEMSLDVQYVTEYGNFYDILFVNRDGLVFHSMRRESDFGTNLLNGPLKETSLARVMPGVRKSTLVDYEYYEPSSEPASFFIVPVFDPSIVTKESDSGLLGWMVLQSPLNTLNSIVSDRDGLGRTGEVYLVNTKQCMMTQSRFKPESTSLQQSVETRAVRAALESGLGQDLILDYRGVSVLSAYERFDVFGTTWVIVAEMDEDEAITEDYRTHSLRYRKRIEDFAGHRPAETEPVEGDSGFRRVDMNEYARGEDGTILKTHGVATCSAIAAILPGEFAYLAHIGPSDVIYGQDPDGHNGCFDEMLFKIHHFEIPPSQKSKLEFIVIAAHKNSIIGSVDSLLDSGIELAQIRFACHPQARYANVVVDSTDGSVIVKWTLPDGSERWERGNDALTVESVIHPGK